MCRCQFSWVESCELDAFVLDLVVRRRPAMPKDNTINIQWLTPFLTSRNRDLRAELRFPVTLCKAPYSFSLTLLANGQINTSSEWTHWIFVATHSKCPIQLDELVRSLCCAGVLRMTLTCLLERACGAFRLVLGKMGGLANVCIELELLC